MLGTLVRVAPYLSPITDPLAWYSQSFEPPDVVGAFPWLRLVLFVCFDSKLLLLSNLALKTGMFRQKWRYYESVIANVIDNNMNALWLSFYSYWTGSDNRKLEAAARLSRFERVGFWLRPPGHGPTVLRCPAQCLSLNQVACSQRDY